MSITVKALNTLVIAFLEEGGDTEAENLVGTWMETSNQKKVKSLVAKINKPPKDKNAPRRGKSAYLFFCDKHRGEVKEDLGEEAKATEVTTELGVRWNILKDDEDRQDELTELMELAEADRERYETEKANYTPPTGLGQVKKGPKRPQSAYLFFCAAYRQEIKEEMLEENGESPKATDVTKELGRRWNEIKSENGEEEFVKLAEKDKARYFAEKEAANGKSSVKPVKKPPATKKKTTAKKTTVKKTTTKTTTKKTAKKAVKKKAPKKATEKN